MTPEQFAECFFRQKDEFDAMFGPILLNNLEAVRAAKPKPSDALAFAEWLLVCPTPDEAQARMQQGPSEARAFSVFADQISDAEGGKLSDELAADCHATHTQFFVLALCVKEKLERHRREQPQEWS